MANTENSNQLTANTPGTTRKGKMLPVISPNWSRMTVGPRRTTKAKEITKAIKRGAILAGCFAGCDIGFRSTHDVQSCRTPELSDERNAARELQL